MISPVRRPLRAVALAACALLAGCASLPEDGGFGPLQDLAAPKLGQRPTWNRTADDAQRSQARVAELLHADASRAGRLANADDAVQIALLNNPDLQAALAGLGIAQADLVQATRLPNPGFSFARTHAGDDIKIERSLSLSLIRLVTLPATSRIEARRLEQVRLSLAQRLLDTAAQTRQAYYRALAAQQALVFQEQVGQAAEAAHELATRMAARGNISRLDAAREQLFYAQTLSATSRAQRDAAQDKETLARLLGLAPDFALPASLPPLPTALAQVQAEQQAMTQRLDVQAARIEVEGLQQSLGLVHATRLVNVLDLGYVRNTESGRSPEVGYQVDLEIPLFDWGQARMAKAEAIYMQGAQRLAATALDARAQVRLAWREREDAFATAQRYAQLIVPLRQRVSEENLLRYNGMLISVFELLADAREQASTVAAAIEAQRDFWLADSRLQLALGGPQAPHQERKSIP